MLIHGGDIYTYKGMLDFSANLNPLGLPDSVVAAAKRGCELGAAYPDPLCRELIAAIAEYEGVVAEQIVCGNGAADLIFRIVGAARPKRALLIAPGFAEYEQALLAVGCEIEYYYLREENGWRVCEDYLRALESRPDIAFVCNPNNPTGLTVEPSLLRRILLRAGELSVRLVVDECFNDFLADGEAHTLKSALSDNPQLFILKAFTKTYAMAGLRLGYGLSADGELLAAMRETAQPWSVSTPAQMAGVAALSESAYVERARVMVQAERVRLLTALEELGCRCFGSEANYIFFKAQAGLTEACRKEGVLIRDCANYHGLGEGYYRVAVKLPQENDRLIDCLKIVLGKLPIA